MSKSKKIILPPKRQKDGIDRSSVVLLPELQHVLDDAAHIVGAELAKMRRRAEAATAPMDPETARLFQGYVKSAVELSRESRENDKQNEAEDFSDKELLDMFLESMPKEEVVRLLQDKINDKKPEAQEQSSKKEQDGE